MHSRIHDLVSKMALSPKGAQDSTSQLRLAIALPLRNHSQLQNLLKQLYNPTSQRYHHFLTVSQFTREFGPSEQDYKALMAFVRTHGLTVSDTTPNRMILDVTGGVANVERAFHTSILVYHDPKSDRDFYAPDSEPSLHLAVPVLDIAGLTDYYRSRPGVKPHPISAAATNGTNVGSGPGNTYEGYDFRSAYAPGVSLTGSGQAVGLVEFDGYNPGDISNYETNANPSLPNVTLQNVLIDGATSPAGETKSW